MAQLKIFHIIAYIQVLPTISLYALIKNMPLKQDPLVYVCIMCVIRICKFCFEWNVHCVG